jgi:hypothetical protein
MGIKMAWLIVMAGLAIVALAVAIAINNPDLAGKVLAIAAGAVGAIVAVGPALMRNGHKDET